MKIKNTSVAESLYRFFAAFEGFDASHPLGFEGELPSPRGFCQSEYHIQRNGHPVACTAVFSMDPTMKVVRRYIHGVRTLRGTCSISCFKTYEDMTTSLETAMFFDAFGDYIRTNGKNYTDGDRVYRICPDTLPSRAHITPGGVMWEIRCSVEMREPKVKGE